MRVLYFSRSYTPHDHRFLAALSRTEHEVTYLRLENGRRPPESRPLPEGIRPLILWGESGPIRGNAWPMMVVRLRRALHDLKPDLVHAGPVQACAFPTAVSGFRPLLSMSWGSDPMHGARRGLGRLSARFALQRSAAFTCDCLAVRRRALELGMAEDRIVVFPWGVDLDHFTPSASALRSALGWEGEFVLFSSRSWEPIYGIQVLVEGFLLAARQDPELRLLLLGDGSLRPLVERRIAQAAARERVHLAGRVQHDRLSGYYRAADLYLSASRSDGSSVSLMEAMACGLPALVSDIPGNQEWVEPGVSGWWFADGDPKALAEGILRAKRHADSLKAMGMRGREIAETRADWQENFPRLLEAYQIALAGPRALG